MKNLKGNVTPAVYKTYLEKSVGVEMTSTLFIIAVANDGIANYLESNYRRMIERHLFDVTNNELTPSFVLVEN